MKHNMKPKTRHRNKLAHALLRSFVLVSTVCSLSLSQTANADPAGWVGGLFGLSVPDAENSSSRPIFGITGGAKVGTEFGVGAYYFNSTKDESVVGVNVPFGFDLYGVELAYHFEGEAKGVYLGGRLGTSKMKFGELSTSPMHYGLVAGYNHMLGDHFSLGGDLSWLSVAKSSGTATNAGITSTLDVDAFNMLNFMATAKLWF